MISMKAQVRGDDDDTLQTTKKTMTKWTFPEPGSTGSENPQDCSSQPMKNMNLIRAPKRSKGATGLQEIARMKMPLARTLAKWNETKRGWIHETSKE